MSKKRSGASWPNRNALKEINSIKSATRRIQSLQEQKADMEKLQEKLESHLKAMGEEVPRELTFKEQLRASFNKKKQVSIKTTPKEDSPEFEEI